MATTNTDATNDPMDLGGFMQTFVLSNPFKDGPGNHGNQHLSPTSPGPGDPISSSRGNTEAGDDGDSYGTDLIAVAPSVTHTDTTKGHVGSNTSYATALRRQQVALPHIKVQSWLKENYCYVSCYSGLQESKALLAEVTQHFPHVTGNILSKVMTFTFPDCPKINNINSRHGYRGLISKPQPEDYCNIDLLKAASHAKKCGLVSLAAEIYGVPENAVANLRYWHSELNTAENLSTDDTMALPEYEDPVPPIRTATRRSTKRTKIRRRRHRKLPKDFLDPETLTDLEDENPTNQKRGHESEQLHDEDIKCEVMDRQADGDNTHSRADSMLQNLLRGQTTTNLRSTSLRSSRHKRRHSQCFSDKDSGTLPDEAIVVKSESDNLSKGDLEGLESEHNHLGTVVVVKPEPVDSSYNPDWQSQTTGHGSSHKIGIEHEPSPLLVASRGATRSAKNQRRRSDMEQSSNTSNPLETETDHLKAKIAWLGEMLDSQERVSAERDSELEASRRQIAALKATVRSQQDAMVDLIQDFSMVHEQFQKLTNKFTSALAVLSKDGICMDDVGLLCQNNNNDITRDGDTSVNRPGSNLHGRRKSRKV